MTSSQPDPERRSFLSWMLGTSLGALLISVLYPVWRFLNAPERHEASTHEVDAGASNDPELLEKGYKIVRFGQEPVILVRLPDGDFRAFSATCTHLDCIVEYQKDKQRIWCNCHNGEYDLKGRVVAGPPPRPLESYRVDLVARGTRGPRNVVISKA